IFNFVYSSPQIFGLVPCPRHRLPKMAVDHPLPRRLVSRLQQEADSDQRATASDSNSESSQAGQAPMSADATGASSALDSVHQAISTAMTSFSKSKNGKPKRGSAGRRSRSSSSASASSMAYMVASRTTLEGARPLGLAIVRLYEYLGIANVERDGQGTMVSVNNLTLLNLVLVLRGRLTESQLNNCILLIQILNSLLAFFIRYRLSHMFYF
ncbi:tunicamycin resistance protein, partial [Coemansia sp. RSA 2673]